MTAALTATASQAVIERHFLHRGHGAEFEMEAAWIRAQLPPQARRVLDLGCGGGALLPTLGLERSMGIDLQAPGLAHTRRRFPQVPMVCGSADRLALSDASLDAIVLQHVIEHLPDVSGALAEWHRVLRPGGALLVQTPNADFVDLSIFDDPTHVRVFSASELGEAITAADFEVVDLRSLGLPWFRNLARAAALWRLRRFVTDHATLLSRIPGLRASGQTLCCAARRAKR
jgi:SAM-dependent methyltransferase